MDSPAPVLSTARLDGDRRFRSLIQFFARSTMEGTGTDIETLVVRMEGEERRTRTMRGDMFIVLVRRQSILRSSASPRIGPSLSS
jgi:hypothetical protein